MKKKNKILSTGKKYFKIVKSIISKCIMIIAIVSSIANDANVELKVIVDVKFTDIQEKTDNTNNDLYSMIENHIKDDKKLQLKILKNRRLNSTSLAIAFMKC